MPGTLCSGGCGFEHCQQPELLYNYTSDGKVVSYNPGSEIVDINARLKTGASRADVKALVERRETLLRAATGDKGQQQSFVK